MDPAGTGSCMQDDYNLQISNPRTLCTIGSESLNSPEPRPDYLLRPTETDLGEVEAMEVEIKSKENYGWRRVIRNFTPS